MSVILTDINHNLVLLDRSLALILLVAVEVKASMTTSGSIMTLGDISKARLPPNISGAVAGRL